MPHAVYLLLVYYQLGVVGLQLSGHLKVICSLVVSLQCLVSKRPTEIRVCIGWLLLKHLVEVLQGLLVFVNKQVALGPLVIVFGALL